MKQVFFVSVGAVKKSNKLPEVTGNLTRNTKKKKTHLSSTLPFCLRLDVCLCELHLEFEVS